MKVVAAIRVSGNPAKILDKITPTKLWEFGSPHFERNDCLCHAKRVGHQGVELSASTA